MSVVLLACILAGEIMRNNVRWTVTEEAIAMGGGTIFDIVHSVDITFPRQENVSVYGVIK